MLGEETVTEERWMEVGEERMRLVVVACEMVGKVNPGRVMEIGLMVKPGTVVGTEIADTRVLPDSS